MNPLSLLAAADEAPERVAVVIGERAYRYAELAPPVRRACAWLESRGAQRVALVAENRLDTLVWLYALLERGTTAVMLHPRLTPPERQRIIQVSAPDLTLDEACLPAWRDAAEVETSRQAPDPRHILAIVFTSGTTGQPRGALLSRRAFLAAARASADNLGWQDDDRWLLCMPLAHVGGLSIVTRCLIARRTVVLAPKPDIAASLVRDRITLASLVPTQLLGLLATEAVPPKTLRALLLGGAAASDSLLERAAHSGWPCLATYGLTEACSQVTTQRYGQARRADVGPPVLGMEIRLVEGQIHIRGESLFSGSLDQGASPLDADGFFPTGDLGVLEDDGHLRVLARRTDLIVSGGENVYPAEVEGVLARAPGIHAACVFGAEDPLWGQLVCAALVASPAPSDIDLLAFLSAELAAHKRPRRIVYVPELPVTPSGKLDRAAARAALEPKLRSLGV
jgi:O-succinylbenzoic acid--CoA ligase